jgi:hypothetical protein
MDKNPKTRKNLLTAEQADTSREELIKFDCRHADTIHVIFGCAIDVRASSWIGNPCTANKIWTVAAFPNSQRAVQICKQLNEASENDNALENLVKLHASALPSGWPSADDKYDEEWVAIGYQVFDTPLE